MPLCCVRAGRVVRYLAAAALVGGLGLVGCGQQPTSQPVASDSQQATNEAQSPRAVAGNQAVNQPPAVSVPAVAGAEDPLHLPFARATREADNPPADSNRPPDETVSKKSVYKLLKAVHERWDSIRFTSPDGKKIDYSATVDTSVGSFRIALRPDLAPNHVRNFIALAEAGYYDELFVDRIRMEQEGDRVLRSIEAGCPLGTGETGDGSIGYWLKDEIQPTEKATHEEGTVSACRSIEPDTAACRFAVLLTPAPYLDGNYTIFGKVVEGLDVVRKIHVQPVIIDDQDRDGARRPEKPVVIKKVTIQKNP